MWTVTGLASPCTRQPARAGSCRPVPCAALMARASRRDDRVLAAAAWQAFPAWVQWTDDPTGEIVARLTDLDDRSVWRSVVPAVVALVAAETGGPVLPAAVETLADLDV